MSISNSDLWRRKLAAYLHDPPEKAYDFGPRHHERAKTHAASFGVAELWHQLTSSPDWSSAAADRFIFPHGSKVHESFGDPAKTVFVHPISGRCESSAPALPTGSLQYPGPDDAEAWLSDIRPEWRSDDPQTLFLRAWRSWSDHAADHAGGRGRGAELLPYLPADTRIPDGSIWHHCAIVSALEGTRAGDDPKAALRPAFLLFQVGPVQDFIAQARSTRDLWSGSYLLSWLTMHAIKAVADQCGPDAIIFPSLKGQPIYDFLERRLDLHPHDNEVLVPGIPNRFLALVPANFNAAEVEKAFLAEWRLIASECRLWLIDESKKGGDLINFAPPYGSLFEQQIDRHWHFTWQLWPWQQANDALAAFRQLPLGRENAIHLAKLVAEAIPDAHKDERCYRDDRGKPSKRGHLDPGWAWSAHYQLCQHALDARRAVRDFHGLLTDPTRKPGHRDALGGREEAVVQSDALEHLKSPTLRALFRHADPLGAANLIKRIWHRAYLERLNEVPGKPHLPALKRARESFDSVPSVAAGAWLARLKTQLANNQELWFSLVGLSDALSRAAAHLRGVNISEPIGRSSQARESRWLDKTETEVFTDRFWQNLESDTAAKAEVQAAAEAVRRFKQKFGFGEPPSYYAVLALDGDQIGKWLSGEKSSLIQNVISPKAWKYFEETMLPTMTEGERVEFAEALQKLLAAGNVPEKPSDWQGQWPPQSAENWIRAWLASPRPISPSWHLQFSEALVHFGLHAARRIVEDVHHGQLIYSGGDDVLAMLPADTAIACATDLRAAFQGRRAVMSPECQRHFHAEAPEGFLWLDEKHRKAGGPSWPLLVPGPRMTVSVGLAIGHVKEPMQDMIAEAQKAEKRAKAGAEVEVFEREPKGGSLPGLRWKPNEGWGRDALAVTLFKRSGETVRWGAKFGSAAFPLLRYFQSYYRTPWDNPKGDMPISGNFPYRIAELLERYGTKTSSKDMLEVAKREVAFAIGRQTITDKEADERRSEFRRATLQEHCEDYLAELASFAWLHPEDSHPTAAPRPLGEFIHLFALEAFIRRQAD